MSRRLSDIATCCTIEGNGAIMISGISADSRNVRPGELFAALPGSRVDGARFIPGAVEKGAAAVLVARDAGLPPLPDHVAVVRADDPARALALMAARFMVHQPVTIAAVTGTNGKSSVAEFTRQIWADMGFRAASLGTIGVSGPDVDDLSIGHTTPDAVTLHRTLASLRKRAISHLAMEASSHGLAQRRLDGVRLGAAAFTSFSRDHLDYHGDMAAYFAAKMRLFDALLHRPAAAVINMDDQKAEEVRRHAEKRGLRVLGVGEKGDALKLLAVRPAGLVQFLTIAGRRRDYDICLPLIGRFQVENALVAAGLVIACGGPEEEAVKNLERLQGARGRLELVGRAAGGAPVFVDYAHTPDALRTALAALRPHTTGRLIVVFGAGGDRDRGKRPLMGEAAAGLADVVIVTDDNPRHEDPAAIRKEVLTGCPGAREIPDRAAAIADAVAMLGDGDVLLVAGKGHETGQIVGDETIPFSDHEEIARHLKEPVS